MVFSASGDKLRHIQGPKHSEELFSAVGVARGAHGNGRIGEAYFQDSAAGLLDAIRQLEADGRDGMGEFDPQVEYFYSTMERYLIQRVGETVAGDINIGRTRPEPLVRIVMRERLIETARGVLALREQLLELAETHRDTVMPLGTHMQHAQIITLGHYLVGMVNAFERDLERADAVDVGPQLAMLLRGGGDGQAGERGGVIRCRAPHPGEASAPRERSRCHPRPHDPAGRGAGSAFCGLPVMWHSACFSRCIHPRMQTDAASHR